MQKGKRRGFTLIELLIVIVVIGILSAMMMLSSKEAVSSAKAAKIISDLTNLKKAALAFYADNLDAIEGRGTLPSGKAFTSLNDNSDDVLKYLGTVKVNGNYKFSDVTTNTLTADKMAWFIWYDIQHEDKDVIRKLAQRGDALKLRFSHYDNDTAPGGGIFNSANVNNGAHIIGLHIRGRWQYDAGQGTSPVF